MKNTFVVIPSLSPDRNQIMPLIKKLKKKFPNIIVVDDGSSEEYRSIFNDIEKEGVVVLRHYINYGKGRALKTATNYILCNYKNVDAIVTADSDGQHSPEDIEKCAIAAKEHSRSYILGVRDFDKANVPKRSEYGNKITRRVFSFFVGLNITDTQTGLRAMSKEVAIKMLDVAGERFEYETNTLLCCKEKSIPIQEVPISTIYLNENKGSHFNAFKDSFSIYKLFFKYIIASGSSFIVDILLFMLFLNILHMNNLSFFAAVFARIISSIYNYLVNSKLVFKKMKKKYFIKYVILVIVQMIVSATLTNYIPSFIGITSNSFIVFIKIVVDIIIFLVNFVVQREIVFKN